LSNGFQVGVRSSVDRLEVYDYSETTICSAIVGEPGKIRKDGRDQIAVMSAGRSQNRGV